MSTRVALYLRVSTGRQADKELSIPDQRRQAHAYCERKGWTVAEEFEERGASATDDKRPAFQKMMDAATHADTPFDVIVVHSYSRFFRDAFQLEFHLRRLRKADVNVVSITQETGDDPMSQLVRKIVALFDEYQSKENAKHTLRAMQENARQGFWNGSRPPYGYRTVVTEQRGDKAKKKLEIDPHEAEIVRLLFRLHIHGHGKGRMGLKAIVDHLDSKNIRYRSERRFSKGLVHRLLTRETYAGRHWFNQTHAKTGQEKPKEEWIAVEVPPIIDGATFAQTRASLASRSPKLVAPRIVSSPVLLTGLVRCASCGGAMTLRTGKSGRYRYYTCSTCAQKGKTACKGRSLPMSTLDEAVLTHLADRLFVPERMTKILAEHAAASQSGAGEWKQKAKEAESELRDVDSRLNRLYDMVERGITPLDESLRKRIAQLRQRREEALRLKAAAERRRHNAAQPTAAPARLDAFCAEMRARLLGADIETRKAYLRLFVELIEVDDSEVRIFGSKSALETRLSAPAETPETLVPSFGREWRPRGDSNTRPTV